MWAREQMLGFLLAQSFHLSTYPLIFSPFLCAPSWTLKVTHYICGLPFDHVRTHLHCCSHGEEQITSHGINYISSHESKCFASTTKDTRFHVSQEIPMYFHPFPFSLLVSKLTLCYQLMTFAPLLM